MFGAETASRKLSASLDLMMGSCFLSMTSQPSEPPSGKSLRALHRMTTPPEPSCLACRFGSALCAVLVASVQVQTFAHDTQYSIDRTSYSLHMTPASSTPSG